MSCSILISGSDIDYNKALCNALLKITNVYEITLSEKRFDKRSSKNYFAVIINNTENDIGEIIWKYRSEEHTSELQSRENLVCRLLLEKKK